MYMICAYWMNYNLYIWWMRIPKEKAKDMFKITGFTGRCIITTKDKKGGLFTFHFLKYAKNMLCTQVDN